MQQHLLLKIFVIILEMNIYQKFYNLCFIVLEQIV